MISSDENTANQANNLRMRESYQEFCTEPMKILIVLPLPSKIVSYYVEREMEYTFQIIPC